MRGTISFADPVRVAPQPPPPPFVPFNINIRIETRDDLASIWARFNMSGEVLADAAQRKARSSRLGAFCPTFVNTISRDPSGKKGVWKLLNEELKKAGIRRR